MSKDVRLSIAQVVFAIALTIALALAGTIILYSRAKSHDEAVLAATALMRQSAEIVRLRAAALLDPIEVLATRSPAWRDVEVQPDANGHPVRPQLLAIMQSWPQIAGVEFGYDNGDVYRLSAIEHFAAEHAAAVDATTEAWFLEETVGRDADGAALLVRRLLDADGAPLRTIRSSGSGVEPRDRPWFAAALATDGLVRTDVYTLAGSDHRGLTVSRRHPSGVVGIDISLRELQRFLDATPQAATGMLAIVHSDGLVLARSTPAAADVETAAAAHGEVADALLQRFRNEPGFRTGAVGIDGEAWLGDVTPIALGAGTRELLVLAMPMASVVEPFERVARNAMLVSVLIVAAFVPLIWLVSRWVSRPLVKLAASADAIRRFELADDAGRLSRVAEIGRLEEALANMRGHLRTFASYVPKALVRLWIERAETPILGGERREITVLFMDLENFTAMSATLTPEEVMRRMARYFEVVTQTLHAHEATIDKYIGDAVMAFWNAPLDTEDHVAKACRAALAVVEAARAETAGWSAAGAPVRTRIGLHCGEAIVGNVGSSDRMNYTALGAAVNLAARLETMNREQGTDVLVSAAIAARIGDRFVLERVGSTELKGFADPVEVFALKGLTPPAGPDQAVGSASGVAPSQEAG